MTAKELVAAVVRGDVVDWPGANRGPSEEQFLRAVSEHSVAALVVWRLRQASTFRGWPDSIRASLSQIVREEVLLEMAREGELQRLIATLGDAGVPSLLIKGVALAYSRYPQPWLRPRMDNDLLIRRSDLPAAGRILMELGYEQSNVLAGELVSHQTLYIKVDPVDSRGLEHVVDLHWQISNRPLLATVLSFDELWRGAVAVPALGAAAWAPGNVHALLLACVHPVAHHGNSDRLLWCYDIHVLASCLGEAEFDAFTSLACDKQVAAICASGLRRASQYFHTAVPSIVMERLAAASGEASASYLGPQTWRGDVRLADLRTLVGWRAKLQFIREVGLPSAEYMRKAYGVSNSLSIPALHAYRLTRGTWRLLRRLTAG